MAAPQQIKKGNFLDHLIKGLEDLKVEYDMTVRNNKSKIIQFHYGGDNMEPIAVENQQLPLAKMTLGLGKHCND